MCATVQPESRGVFEAFATAASTPVPKANSRNPPPPTFPARSAHLRPRARWAWSGGCRHLVHAARGDQEGAVLPDLVVARPPANGSTWGHWRSWPHAHPSPHHTRLSPDPPPGVMWINFNLHQHKMFFLFQMFFMFPILYSHFIDFRFCPIACPTSARCSPASPASRASCVERAAAARSRQRPPTRRSPVPGVDQLRMERGCFKDGAKMDLGWIKGV